MTQSIITNWQDKHRQMFGKHQLKLEHSLSQSRLFSEEALSNLIERYPDHLYELTTMGHDRTVNEWREGEIGCGARGSDVLEAIRKGRMWLNLRRVAEVDPAYGDLRDAMFAEFEDRVPGFNSYKHTLGILVSSPNVQVYYHADQPGQMLWQIAGRKSVYVYPTGEPFLNAPDLEGILMRETEEEVPYQTWFDDHAMVYDFGPGEMLYWPLNAPHRIVNHDCLNVSVTTEFWTREVRNSFAVNYANGVLRRSFGLNPKNRHPEGLHVYPKAAFAYAWKKLGLNKGREFVHRVTFRADASSPYGQVPVEAYDKV